ncbi:MAG: hypothetical protein ACKVTZ_05135 [Bacteroidia bacterium]
MTKEIRTLYQQAVTNSEAAEKLWTLVENADNHTILLGYRAAAYFFKAKNASMLKAYTYFQAGKKDMERAILLAPDSVELRYLRFTLQWGTPSLLGYKTEMKIDKQFILNAYPALEDADLTLAIFTFWKDFLKEELV